MTDLPTIATIATFLEERIDWLEVALVDSETFPREHGRVVEGGKDIVIRIDGTYFGGAEEGMTEYFAERLHAAIKTAQWSAAAKIRKQRAADQAGSTKIKAAATVAQMHPRSTSPSW